MHKDFHIAWYTWLSFRFALKVKISIVWYVTPCSPLNLLSSSSSGLKSKSNKKSSWCRQQEVPNKWRMFDFQRNTRRYTPNNRPLHSHRCENPNSYLLQWSFLGYIANSTELVIRSVNTFSCSKLLTNSTDQSPSWEINRSPATQRMPRLLRELRFMTNFDTVQIPAKGDFQLIRVHSCGKGNGEFITVLNVTICPFSPCFRRSFRNFFFFFHLSY
jgi:hypothetical protein